MSISGKIMPVFEHLGLREELGKISKECMRIGLHDVEMNKITDIGMRDYKEL
jgi:hypothetical protein